MNTLQINEGKGDSANLTEQTAQNATQTAKKQAQTKPTYQPLNPKTALLNTVSTFFGDRDTDDVIQVINDLTRDWLKTVLDSNEDANRDSFSKKYVTNVLFTLNKVTEFIVALQQCDSRITQSEANTVARMQDDLTRAYEEQISLLNQLAEGREQAIELLKKRVSLLSEKEQSDPQG